MKLSTKLALSVSVGITLVMAADAMLRVQREASHFEHDMRGSHRAIGRAVAAEVAREWRSRGEAEVPSLVEEANEREGAVLIQWVWLDAPAGDPRRPGVSAEALRPVSGGQVASLRWRPQPGKPEVLSTFTPVVGPRATAIEVRESLEAEDSYLHETVVRALVNTLALIALCAVLVMGLGSLLVGRPVRRLVEHARSLGAGVLSARLALSQGDEIGQLAGELNAMAEHLAEARRRMDAEAAARLLAIEQLRHSERLTTVGKLAAGVAHEMGTPLNVIAGHAQLIVEEHPAGTSANENAAVIAIQAQRLTAIIRQLLHFARRRAPAKASHDLGGVVRETVSMLSSLGHKKGVEIGLVVPAEPVLATLDPVQIQQVLTNLVVNAVHATPGGGVVTVGLDRRAAQPPADHEGPRIGYSRLYVQDPGAGMTPETLAHIFEPFFTTKEPGEGTGLGLPMAYGIVKDHEGWIGVETELGKGSCFSVYLPLERSG